MLALLGTLVGAFGLALGIYQTVLSRGELDLAQQAFQYQRRLSSYEIMNNPQASPEATLEASQSLLETDGVVRGWKVPCAEDDPTWNNLPGGVCARLVNTALNGVEDSPLSIVRGTFEKIEFKSATMSYVNFTDSNFEGGRLSASTLTDVFFDRANFRTATINLLDGSRVVFSGSDLTNATLVGDFAGSTFPFSDVSGIDLCNASACSTIDPGKTFQLAYFRKSNPPRNLDMLPAGLQFRFVCADDAAKPAIDTMLMSPTGCENYSSAAAAVP